MDEAERRFAEHLRADGWRVSLRDRSDADMIASIPGTGGWPRRSRHTQGPGPGVNTLYCQLLRRMTDPATPYAAVVPESLRATVERVPTEVHRRLGVEV